MSNRRAAILALALFVLNAFSNNAGAQPAPWTLETLKLPSSPVRLFMSTGGSSFNQLRIETRNKGWFTVGECGGKPCIKALKAGYKRAAPPPHALPDAQITTGKRNIRAAWLAGPTRRYDHGVLGDAIEAGKLVVDDTQGKRHTLTLPNNAVFEDRFARLADLDGDGSDEIIVVKSYLNKGAALAVLILTPKGLEIVAETPPIGRAHRWLNPAGIADYDGDKRDEVAIVVTPHIGGRLEFWDYRDGRLRRQTHLNGYSNHAIGSRAQQMSASADFDGDGVTDLALPSQDKRAIAIISFAGGSAKQMAHVALPGRVVTEIIAIGQGDGKRPALVMGLDRGQLAILR
jgi:hypothetical protein